VKNERSRNEEPVPVPNAACRGGLGCYFCKVQEKKPSHATGSEIDRTAITRLFVACTQGGEQCKRNKVSVVTMLRVARI